jgi:hypothetical protein
LAIDLHHRWILIGVKYHVKFPVYDKGTLDTIHRLFFVTRLIINKIIKVQWVDFKLENVLVSLHSLKTMSLGSIIFGVTNFAHAHDGITHFVHGITI